MRDPTNFMLTHSIKSDYSNNDYSSKNKKIGQKTNIKNHFKTWLLPFLVLFIATYFYNTQKNQDENESITTQSLLSPLLDGEETDLRQTVDLYALLSSSSSTLFPDSSLPLIHQNTTQQENIHQANIHQANIHQEAPPETQRNKNFTLQVKPGDTLTKLFKQMDLPNRQLNELLSTISHRKQLEHMLPGQTIHFEMDAHGNLSKLSKHITPIKILKVEKQANNTFKSMVYERAVEREITFGTATISDSLFQAGKRANLNDKLIMSLAAIFAYDIDFAMDIYPNDQFKILYEEYYADGEKVGTGHILRAEFNARGKNYKAIRYTDPNGQAAYFTPEGKSLYKSFTRNPVEYTRISSHFNLERRHPVLHKIRAHRGVDYAAPYGTPIRAVGDGKISFIGSKGGYGNVIELQHGKKYSTLYGHMQNFAPRLKQGDPVKQGEIIGYVGSTGLATGPHLHYEFRINGIHQNPLTVPLPEDYPHSIVHDQKFFELVKKTDQMIRSQEKTLLAKTIIEKSDRG